MKALDQDGLDYVVDKIYDLVNSGGSADYIVEEGQSGIWTYRKWASGVAECWGKVTVTLSGTGTLWKTPIYAYLGVNAQNYPFEFYEVPTETVNVTQAQNAVWLYKQAYAEMNNTKTKTAAYALIKVDAFDNGSTAVLSYHVKGLWKEFTPSVSHEHAIMQTGTGTKTSAVSSFERCYWQKFGNLVFVAFTFSVASSGITVTSKFFTGLPKPVAYFRFSGTLGNTSKACRLSMNADGSISNAYTVVGDIQGGVVDGSVVYFTNE